MLWEKTFLQIDRKKRSSWAQERKKQNKTAGWCGWASLKKKKRHQKSLKPHQGAKTSAKWGVDKGSKLINKQKGALPCKVWMTKRENQELESVSYHFHHKSWWWGGGFNTATSLTFSLFLPPFFFFLSLINREDKRSYPQGLKRHFFPFEGGWMFFQPVYKLVKVMMS